MPKVTDAYVEDKRSYILACAGEVLREKPLYLVKMRDIIAKAGFSQGVIYRYYANLDELYVSFINEHTIDYPLEQEIDALLQSDRAEKDILAGCFAAMGAYLQELLRSVVGKTFFEWTVLYAHDAAKREALFPRIRFKRSLAYAERKIVEYALRNIEAGVFHPRIPVRSILLLVGTAIDGVAQSMALRATGGGEDAPEAATDIPDLFQALAKAVVYFVEE